MTSPQPRPRERSFSGLPSTFSESPAVCTMLRASSERFAALNASISRLLWPHRLTSSQTPLGILLPRFEALPMTGDPLGPRRWLARAVAAAIILVGLAAVAFAGCAHVSAVETACKPTAADDVRIIGELAQEDWAAALAPEVLCVVNAVVAQVLAPQTGQALTVAGGPDMTVVRAHAAAWRTAHP